MTTAPLGEEGTVYSWTRVRVSDSDRLMVMADFFQGRLRVTAPLIGVDLVDIGDTVALVIPPDIPYAFVPTV